MVIASSCSDRQQANRDSVNSSHIRGDKSDVKADNAYDIASDPNAFVNARLAAVRQLTPIEKSRLRELLLKEVPGKLDLSTLNAIYLLGEIGNEESAKQLDDIRKFPLEVPGKIGTAIDLSIERIQERTKRRPVVVFPENSARKVTQDGKDQNPER